jgi:hypothetical protein
MVNDDKTTSYVHQAIMLGWPRAAVDQWAAQQAPPVSSGDLDRAYAACVERWLRAANRPDEELFARHVARREDLYRRAMQQEDLGLAHKVLVDQAKLQQQYRTEQRRAQEETQAEAMAARIRDRAQKPRLVTGRGA